MGNAFIEKLRASQAETSIYALYVAPQVEILPPEIARYDDPFLPYARSIMAATHDLVCGYVFGFAAYLALGGAGTVALERSISLVGNRQISVLDAQFSNEAYANVWDETAFNLDAVTIAPDAPLSAYEKRDDRQAFVVSDTPISDTQFSPADGWFIISGVEIKLLPLDTLYRARALNFESKLREVVENHVKH